MVKMALNSDGCQLLQAQRVCRRHIRGFLEPALLLLLHLGDGHGYDLCASLTLFGLGRVDPSLVYRMLRELEAAGLVDSQWQAEQALGPARRVYRLTQAGEAHLDAWIADLRHTDQALHYFFQVYECRKVGRRPLSGDNKPQISHVLDYTTTNQTGEAREMNRIAVSAEGEDLDTPVNPVFGRCANFILVNPDTLEFEVLDNPAAGAGGGAGIQAAQFIIEHGARAVLTGNVGPNAFEVFKAANVPIYMVQPNLTIRQAVERFQRGELQSAAGANVGAHAGMRRGQRGKTAAVMTEEGRGRSEEIERLRRTAADLRRQLADVMAQIEKLEESR